MARLERAGCRRQAISEDDFYRKDHLSDLPRVVGIVRKNMPCDAVTIGEWFDSMDWRNSSADQATSCNLRTPRPAPREHRRLRGNRARETILSQLIDLRTEITTRFRAACCRSTQEILEGANKVRFCIAESGARGRKNSRADADSGKGSVSDPAPTLREQGSVTGLATGFSDLDELTAGLQSSDLIIGGAPVDGQRLRSPSTSPSTRR